MILFSRSFICIIQLDTIARIKTYSYHLLNTIARIKIYWHQNDKKAEFKKQLRDCIIMLTMNKGKNIVENQWLV